MSQAPLHLLFVEPNFPGRLGQFADWLVRKRGCIVSFAHHSAAADRFPDSVGRGLSLVPFNVGGVAREAVVPWQRHLERALCYAYGAWEVIDARRLRPVDAIVAHSGGFGSSLFLPVSYPKIPIVQRFDYYLQPRRNDLADADAAALPPEFIHWRRSANAMTLIELENGVLPWTSSFWQRGLFPSEYQDDFLVAPEAIDTRVWAPLSDRPGVIGERTIDPAHKVVSFVGSSLDRLRGFDRFAEISARLLRERDDVICIAAGDPLVSRMLDVRHFGRAYARSQLEQHGLLDNARFWLLGAVSAQVIRSLLGRSDAHVYPSRVYPCSRSLLEAFASGAPVIAADTAPIREIAERSEPCLLAPPDNPDALAERVSAVLKDAELRAELGKRARLRAVEYHDVDIAFQPIFDAIEARAREI